MPGLWPHERDKFEAGRPLIKPEQLDLIGEACARMFRYWHTCRAAQKGPFERAFPRRRGPYAASALTVEIAILLKASSVFFSSVKV